MTPRMAYSHPRLARTVIFGVPARCSKVVPRRGSERFLAVRAPSGTPVRVSVIGPAGSAQMGGGSDMRLGRSRLARIHRRVFRQLHGSGSAANETVNRTRLFAVLVAFGLVAALTVVLAPTAAAAACTANAIVCENQLPGTPESVWDVDGAGDSSIQGFATSMSANAGQSVSFKIKTNASAYRIEIYRLGYYQGNGARKVADVTPSATLPQNQPACATNAATEIYDCGTWAVSASWTIPSAAVSGVYIARLIRTDTGGDSHIPFIVRSDTSTSQVVFQTSDSTWQAYNKYGGSNFYSGLGNGRAYKLSYNRPFATRGGVTARDYLFSNEYPMIRFLESNGYDLSYISSLDTDIRGSLLTRHKVFLSVGHDEYWSAGQKANVENARDAGVNLAFFSGNEVYWKTRWEPSQDGTNTANRTLVCYKDTWANKQIDPVTSTSTWRDPRFGVGQPENSLTGTIYKANFTDLPLTVSNSEGQNRLWRNTSLSSQPPNTSTALAPHTVGYESDEDLDNGFRPSGLIRLSTTTGPSPEYLTDFGNTVQPATTTHHVTMYRASSGALVFGAGTVQWAWGLDTHHDGIVSPADSRMQQATTNVLADMDAFATMPVAGIVAATKSTDTAPPTAVITAPTSGAIAQGSSVVVSGTATDSGGGRVAGVEVSLDGGVTWHPASGTTTFSYSGVVDGVGSGVIRARAIDDSANIQSAPAVTAATSACPCSIFGDAVPAAPTANDSTSVTLGLKFTSASDGYITGLRFYKGSGNSGTHVGTLYDTDGSVLASVTFANETQSGWQTAQFASAVPIAAGHKYVAAYTAQNGNYAADIYYFSYADRAAANLTALGGPTNLNGVYRIGNGFPTDSYRQTNYFVDVTYSSTDTTPITVTDTSPVDTASSVPTTAAVTAKFSRDPSDGSVEFSLRDAAGQSIAGSTAYDSQSRLATFTPTSALTAGATYTATVTASVDGVGPMSSPAVWSFTTARPDAIPGVCPCSLFNDSDAPGTPSASDSDSVNLGVAFTPDTDGVVTGIRFYKTPGNLGPHTVGLWSASGAALGSAAVTAEGASGWQTAMFSAPVSVSAGTSYIASYRAPAGRYSYTLNQLGAQLDKSPLHTPVSAGRFAYGGVAAPLNSSSTNYFVDPIFTVAAGSAPTVTAVNPVDGSTSVPTTSTTITVRFDTTIQPGSAGITVKGSDGSVVGGSLNTEPCGFPCEFHGSRAI